MPSNSTASAAPAVAPEPGLARHAPGGPLIIAGGGIAGLAAALALARRGIASHVLERRPQLAEEGAGIQIGPNGTGILAEIGVAAILEPHAGKPHSLRVMDGTTGRQITELPLGLWMAERWKAPYWTVHRADLHAALMQSVHATPLIRLSMACEVTGVAQTERGFSVQGANGGSWTGEGLIAGDGLWSPLRSALFPRLPAPQFTGRAALRAVIPASMLPDEIPATSTHIWLRPGAHAVHYPVRGGREIAMVLVVEDQEASIGWGMNVLPAWVHQRTVGFPEQLRTVISLPKAWRKWSLHTMPTLRHWVAGRTALVGDAAHPMLPFLAQGGVMALEDAAVLARSVAQHPDNILKAFVTFEKARRARAARVVRASARNGRTYHMSGLIARARDAVLRSAPPERLMASYDWLYGWKP